MTQRWALARFAARHDGVVGIDQLRALGFTSNRVSRLVRDGILHRKHLGVYAYGDGLTTLGQLRAALMTCGDDAFLSHRTAAALRGLRNHNSHEIHVTVPGHNALNRPGLIVHRTTDELGRTEVSLSSGLRASSVPRMYMELATIERPQQLDELITAGLRKRVLDLDTALAYIPAHRGRPGSARLTTAFRDYEQRPEQKSGLERAFLELISDLDIPAPECNVYIDGWEIDLWWPELKLAVEVDGRDYHLTVKDLEKDKYKDAQLAKLGITVVRFTQARIEHDGVRVREDMLALVAARAA
jgi:hypothetical protein